MEPTRLGYALLCAALTACVGSNVEDSATTGPGAASSTAATGTGGAGGSGGASSSTADSSSSTSGAGAGGPEACKLGSSKLGDCILQ